MAENTANKRLTKVQLVAELAQKTQLDKKNVQLLLDTLSDIAIQQLGKNGPGELTIPGIVRMKTVDKPATQDRQGMNPFTKQPMIIKGKPASKKIRVAAVKALKDRLA